MKKPSIATTPRVPKGQAHKHMTFSDDCWCKPTRDPQNPHILIHNDKVAVEAPRKPPEAK